MAIFLAGCSHDNESGKAKQQSEVWKATTINIKWDDPNEGNNRWDLRKSDLVNFIQYEQPLILGLQEALYHQLQYLDSALVNYGWVGVGRDAGDLSGEFCPILVDTTVFQINASGTFWLSETPESPSKGWDAALPRIATYAALTHLERNEKLFVLNTHFDHMGQQARNESVKVIQYQLKDLVDHDQIIVMGDLNLEPNTSAIRSLVNSGWQDAYHAAQVRFGPEATFNGYQYEKSLSRRIDYIFLSQTFKVLKYKVSSNMIEQRYLSDHFPVTVVFELK